MTIEEVKALYTKHCYPLFEKGDYNINLFGIRSKNRIAGYFDDKIGYAYKVKGRWQVTVINGTVDCGEYYMRNPMTNEGAAFMVEGFYRGLWQLGSFHGTPSLIQVRPVKYYRDGNRDNIMDLDPKTIKESIIGLFTHEHFQISDRAKLIYNSSAACWVAESRTEYKELIKVVTQAVKIWGNSISAALFDEE